MSGDPICCGKRAWMYRKDYGHMGWIEGYRCRVCKRFGIPHPEMVRRVSEFWKTYEPQLDAMREQAIALEQP
jgi:hypothetical protein